jgi:tRNA(Arg) A34 adenosine deaminase TadA
VTAEQDQLYLAQAIELAKNSVAQGGGPFGAVIVRDHQIIGRGQNRVTLNNDPTAHAEITAIRNACATIQHFSLADCILYASCEPCPMCYAAIYWARIKRVVYAATGKDAKAAGFDDTRIAEDICRPCHTRSIELEKQTCASSRDSFILWQQKSDRIEY